MMSQSSNANLATKIRSSYTKEAKDKEFSLKDSLISTFKPRIVYNIYTTNIFLDSIKIAVRRKCHKKAKTTDLNSLEQMEKYITGEYISLFSAVLFVIRGCLCCLIGGFSHYCKIMSRLALF